MNKSAIFGLFLMASLLVGTALNMNMFAFANAQGMGQYGNDPYGSSYEKSYSYDRQSSYDQPRYDYTQNSYVDYSEYKTKDKKYECRTGPFEGFFVSSVEFCFDKKFDKKDRDKQNYYNSAYDYDRGYDYKYGKDEYNKGDNYGKDRYNDEGYEYGKQVFVAKINGDNVRPQPVDTPIFGFGKFQVEEKPSNGETQLRYEVSAFNVPKNNDIIAMHFHAINNQTTQTGPHIITLCGSPANEVECPEGPGVIAAGAALERDIEDDQTFITTMTQLLEALKAGLGYVQIHTSNIPAGEARGDLVEKDKERDNYNY